MKKIFMVFFKKIFKDFCENFKGVCIFFHLITNNPLPACSTPEENVDIRNIELNQSVKSY